jgi:Zn-dependent protease with chaperone function
MPYVMEAGSKSPEKEISKVTSNKKSYIMQYSIVAVLAIVILSTFLLNASPGFWDSLSGNSKENQSESSKDENSGSTNSNERNDIKHDLSCLRDEDIISQGIGLGNDIEDIFMKTVEVEVSIEEERKIGQQAKNDILSQSYLLNDSRYTNRIDRIMKRLLEKLPNPRFEYKWYVVDEDIINAGTCGGYIFINKGIIDFAEDDDELAAILAHEIYHNELGHIAEGLKKEKIAKGIFGDFSDIPLTAATIVTMPNNQYNEANCDLYGIDLSERAGYNGCHAEKLWKRMKQKEGDRMSFEKLFSTHPFSEDRANCINNHMKNNYKRTCSH